MKIKASASALALVAMVVCLIPVPVEASTLSLSPQQGVVGTQVTISYACNYGSGDYHLYWDEAGQLLDQGVIDESCISITFTAPEAAKGKHKVTLKIGDDSFDAEFIIMPSINLSADHGSVGSNLTVTGKGFNIRESNITVTYDGGSVETGIEASSKGSWQSTFTVPASSRGKHAIDAEGTTPADEVDDQTFTLNPQIKISPNSGWVGTVARIEGSGFASGETNITVTYDGLASKTGVFADATGSWQASFSIPTSTKGNHKIDAYGAVTPEIDVIEATFAVSPGIRLELASGHLGGAIHIGDGIQVSGIGFEENEAGVQITFDGILVASGIVSDAKGSWVIQFEVPLSTKGEHTVDASGETTKTGDVTGAILLISPTMEINPTSGAIGDDVVVSGIGFGGSQAIIISYDGNQIGSSTTTDTKGSFTTSFNVPKCQAGDHTITITDATAAVTSTSFSVESTPPATPRLISPEAGDTTGFIGSTTVAFDWSDVDDPSGTYYLMEVSQSADFTGVMIHKEELTQSQYTLTDNEALAKGDYYWRVKAIDGAGNQSGWTTGQLFTVGITTLWLLLAIAIGGIVIIAIIWRVVSVRRRGN